MIRILTSILLILHGLVHLLYFGQSARYFELQPGMVWPDGAWTFSKVVGDETTRLIASILLIIAAMGFVAGGAGLIFKQGWGRPLVSSVSIFSSLLYLLLWDGTFRQLDNQGGIGILINLAILVATLIWPNFEF